MKSVASYWVDMVGEKIDDNYLDSSRTVPLTIVGLIEEPPRDERIEEISS